MTGKGSWSGRSFDLCNWLRGLWGGSGQYVSWTSRRPLVIGPLMLPRIWDHRLMGPGPLGGPQHTFKTLHCLDLVDGDVLCGESVIPLTFGGETFLMACLKPSVTYSFPDTWLFLFKILHNILFSFEFNLIHILLYFIAVAVKENLISIKLFKPGFTQILTIPYFFFF
jgi:hypothetical protein